MARPRVYKRRGQWWADLRSQELGQRCLDLPDSAPESEAVHALYARLAVLRAELQPQGPQAELPFGRVLFRAAAEKWAAETPAPRTAGGAAWRRQVLKRVSRELGSVPVSAFAGQALRDYDAANVASGSAPRTRRNLLSVAAAVARHCGIAPVVPRVSIATDVPPSYVWLAESDFRELRRGLFTSRKGRLPPEAIRRGESFEIYAARRRAFLSVAYYTGLHTIDVGRFSGSDVYCDPAVGTWRRHNGKSSRVVPDAQLPLPEQLGRDLSDLLRLTGRRRFLPAELICGGHWTNGTKAMTAAAARLGLPALNFRVFRRSCVYELALRGWSERDCAEYLGHVDQRMIREVYARWPLGPLVAPSRSQWTAQSTLELDQRRGHGGSAQISTGTARILAFPLPTGPKLDTRPTRKGHARCP